MEQNKREKEKVVDIVKKEAEVEEEEGGRR